MISEASLGDVIRAWRALGANTDEERRAIARLLGFDVRDPMPSLPEPPTPTTPAARTVSPRPAQRAPEPAPSTSVEEVTRVVLVPFPEVNDNDPVLPRVLDRPTKGTQPPPPEPLFAVGWSHAIASMLAERSAPVGELDVELVVEQLARCQPLRALPRRERMVSVAEVVVVVDTRATISWLRDDAAELVNRLNRISRAPLRVLESDGPPVLAARLAHSELADIGDEYGVETKELRIGADGRLIALTDLGLGSPWTRGDPARAEDWITLSGVLCTRGASLVVVTPVPTSRLPASVRRQLACVHWDEATRPGDIHRLIEGLP